MRASQKNECPKKATSAYLKKAETTLTEAKREVEELHERESRCERRQVLHREKKIGQLQDKLLTSTAEVATLRDLNNAAMRKARKTKANKKRATRTRTRTNTNPNGTEANAAGRSIHACVVHGASGIV